MTRPRVLITGFGPFPGVPENPSAWLAGRLADLAAAECDAELHPCVLPTEWQAAGLIPALCASLQPHVMIHFGLSQRATSLRIERHAYNRAARRADAGGALPASPAICPEGPERLETALPVRALAAQLRRSGLAAATSRSAGRYLCNFLYYHSLGWARANGSLAVFVHIPLVSRHGPFNETALLGGARAILRFGLDFARPQTTGQTVTKPAFAAADAVLSAKA